jgi:transcriptional regulator with XRE-family HTH domain
MATKRKRTNSETENLARRKELADFLKTRRARVKPAKDSPFGGIHRRTPGLRREEVSELAQVSVSWYTWLEQARNINASEDLLARIAKILQLSRTETTHLFELAGRTYHPSDVEQVDDIPQDLRNLVTKGTLLPAYVTNDRTQILCWNNEFKRHFFDPERLPKEKRTLLDLIFTTPQLLPKSNEVPTKSNEVPLDFATRIIAEFRWAVRKQIGSDWVKELVSRITRENPRFLELWKRHDILEGNKQRLIEIHNQKDGKKTYSRSVYVPSGAEHLQLQIMTPIPSS